MIYRFYHVTDTHYYSKKNIACDPKSLPQYEGQISFRESEEIVKKAFEIIAEDKETSTVIVTGDLTDNGDRYSHEEMPEILKAFTEKGGNPFVITDTHDYPHFDRFIIDENGKKIPADHHLPEEEVVPRYYPFGRDKAFDKFEGDHTTYIAEILPGLYYIALGYKFTVPDTKHSPAFSDGQMEWVKNHVNRAKEKGGIVICGTHWPVVSPSPAYSVLGKGNSFADGEKRMKEFADMGVRLFFNGHTHIQCMKEIVSDIGNRIYSVQTSALSGFPPKMRKITIDSETGRVEIRTIDMDVPELELGMSLTEYTRKGFIGSLEMIPYNMEHDVEAFLKTDGGISLPKDLIEKYPKVVMFIGKKLNGLTYGKMADFSKKYHRMAKSEYEHLKDKKVVPLLLDIVAHLYMGNASYSPDTVEYKLLMASVKKLEKLLRTAKIDIKKYLCGYTLSEFIEPLLYNSGLDDDNVTLSVDFGI